MSAHPVDLHAKAAVEGSPARFGSWMQTFTGRQFWPMDPRSNEIDVRDIAHALSLQCRYAGHCSTFYSVAEHSVHVARWLLTKGSPVDIALKGLMHDATEAYLVDVPRPVKPFLPGYKEAEARLWEVITDWLGMDSSMPGAVMMADNRILGDERRQNMAPVMAGVTDTEWGLTGEPLGINLQFWSPAMAEFEFLAMFNSLTHGLVFDIEGRL